MFPDWYPVYNDYDGTRFLAVRQRHLQGGMGFESNFAKLIIHKGIEIKLVMQLRDPFIKIYMTTTSVNQFTSSLLLTVMSADRYIAICHPIASTTFRTPLIAKVRELCTLSTST